MHSFLLNNLSEQFDFLENQLTKLDQSALIKRFNPDKWSIHENLAHLGRYQQVFRKRISSILKEDNPQLARYVSEKDPGFNHWVNLPPREVLKRIKADRDLIINDFSKMNPDALQRRAIHPRLGSLTALNWLEFFLLHENHHIYTIFKLIHENRLVL